MSNEEVLSLLLTRASKDLGMSKKQMSLCANNLPSLTPKTTVALLA